MAKVSVQIVGDSSSLHRALGSATSGTSKLGSVFGKVAGIAAGFGVALGAVEILKFGKDSINAAAQVQKSTEAIRADFGHAADRVLSFGESAAKSFGISNASSTAFSAQLGITAKNIGLAHDKAATMSIGLQKLAGSIGLIKGEDPTSVFHTLTLALAGNTRGLKAMGVVITPLNEQLEAQRLGFIGPKGTISSLTAAQKAQVIYGIATKHLTEFQKEAKKHTGDLADQQILLRAQLANVADTLGAKLLPVLTKVTGWMAKNLPVAIAFVTREWAEHRAQVMAVIDAITQAVEKNLPQIEATIRRVWTAISAVTKKVWPAIKTQIVTVINVIGDILHIAMDLIQGHWGAAWGRIKALARDAMMGLVNLIRALVPLFVTVAESVGSAILHGIGAGLRGLGRLVMRALGALKGILATAARDAVGWAIGVGRAIFHGIENGLGDLAGLIKRWVMEALSSVTSVFGGGGNTTGTGKTPPAGFHPGGKGHTTPSFARGNAASVTHVHVYIDGKEIAPALIKADKNYRRQNSGRPLLSGA